MIKNEIDISHLSDFRGTIGELKRELALLEVMYGEYSEIWFEAECNNVSVIVGVK